MGKLLILSYIEGHVSTDLNVPDIHCHAAFKLQTNYLRRIILDKIKGYMEFFVLQEKKGGLAG